MAHHADTSQTITLDDLSALFAVESIKGFGPQKFKQVHEAGVTPAGVIADPTRLPIKGNRGDQFRHALGDLTAEARDTARERAQRQLERAAENDTTILTYTHPDYPTAVYQSNNPIPVLYAHGATGDPGFARAVACVGSRKIRPPYSDLQHAFAQTATRLGLAVASGFALGADTIAHRAAVESGGHTILVLPCGLDRPYPPENRALLKELWDDKYVLVVSEFPFETRASTLTLRKRNKLIVAFARGVLIGQSSTKGGAMNAYRFAREQRKPVATFDSDDSDDTSGNRLIKGEAQPIPLAGTGDASFPRIPAEQEWEAWLRRLSSST